MLAKLHRAFGFSLFLCIVLVVSNCQSLASPSCEACKAALTTCPPYEEEVAFPSSFGLPMVADLLNKFYKRVIDLFEESGTELEETSTGFSAPGLRIEKIPDENGKTKELLISMDGDISFDTGSSRIKPKALDLVKKIAQAMLDNPRTKVKISGHTDSMGLLRDNERLSHARAVAVERAIVTSGVSQSRILDVQGFADKQKIVDTMGPEVRNRRVEMRMLIE